MAETPKKETEGEEVKHDADAEATKAEKNATDNTAAEEAKVVEEKAAAVAEFFPQGMCYAASAVMRIRLRTSF